MGDPCHGKYWPYRLLKKITTKEGSQISLIRHDDGTARIFRVARGDQSMVYSIRPATDEDLE